jgi:phosphatidylethanolamine-binding protein (PEBP) family uncharacterized protein
MKMQRSALWVILGAFLSLQVATAQTAAQPKPAPRLALSVTSTAWPDGGEIPMTYSVRGENKSPAFEFHWNLGTNPTSAPDSLQTYTLIFHDVENSTNKTSADTLHWTVFNIPGSAKGLPEGLASGDLPDGTRNGPGLASRGESRQPTSAPEHPPGRFTITSSNSMLSTPSWIFRPTRHARTCSKPWTGTLWARRPGSGASTHPGSSRNRRKRDVSGSAFTIWKSLFVLLGRSSRTVLRP